MLNDTLKTGVSINLKFIKMIKVFKGTSSYSSDVICNLNDDKIHKGTSTYSSDVICNIDDNKINVIEYCLVLFNNLNIMSKFYL